jgi:hypothetical protein
LGIKTPAAVTLSFIDYVGLLWSHSIIIKISKLQKNVMNSFSSAISQSKSQDSNEVLVNVIVKQDNNGKTIAIVHRLVNSGKNLKMLIQSIFTELISTFHNPF